MCVNVKEVVSNASCDNDLVQDNDVNLAISNVRVFKREFLRTRMFPWQKFFHIH